MTCPGEDLSAYLDGELAPARRSEVEAHLVSCPSCPKELARLRGASAAFKAQGRPAAPAGLAGAALASSPVRETAGRGMRWESAAAVMAVVSLVLVTSGKMLKPQIAGLINQTMGMISGAAMSVGEGGGGGGGPIPTETSPLGGWLTLAWILAGAVLAFFAYRRRRR